MSAFKNIETEKAVIGFLLRHKYVDEVRKVSRMIKPEYFHEESCRNAIVGILSALHDHKLPKVDLLALKDILPKMFGAEQAKEAENAALDSFAHYAPSYLQNAMEQVNTLKEMAAKRTTYKILQDGMSALGDEGITATDVVDGVRDLMRGVSDTGHGYKSIGDVLAIAYESIEKRNLGEERAMPTGIPALDNRLGGGMHNGELTIIGARPGVGKTALALNIAVASAQAGYKVLFISREMSAEQIGARYMQLFANVSMRSVSKGSVTQEQWDRMVDVMASDKSDMQIRFAMDTKTVEDLYTEVDALHERGEVDLVIVDYLQLLGTTNKRMESEYARLTYISRKLKEITLDCNIPVIALAQVSRDTDGSMPSLSHLKGSGAIEQDADNVLFIHVPTRSDDESFRITGKDINLVNELRSEGKVYTLLNIAKQRQGEMAYIQVLFIPSLMRYVAMPKGGAE